MTDRPAVPAPGSRLVAAVATFGAAVLLAGTVLSLGGVATADLATTVEQAGVGALVVTADGARPAVDGDDVPAGATLRTTLGVAVLRTGERTVRVAPLSEVVVRDGARQELRRGALLVDAAAGDGLRVAGRSARTRVPDGSVVRVEQPGTPGGAARVVAYDGSAVVGTAGRRAEVEVDRLHEVRVLPDAVPGRPRPLALTPDDAWEARVLGDVVADDAVLSGLVRAFVVAADGDGAVRAVVARTPGLDPRASALRRAERSLAFALAHEDGVRYLRARDDRLRTDRALGGSWGVVAELARASSADAGRYVDSLLGGRPGPLLAAPGGGMDLTGLLPGGGAVPAPGGVGQGPGDEATAPGGPAAPPRPEGPDPAPAPAPRPPTGPGDPGGSGLPPPVGPIVDSLLDLVPTGLPVPPLPEVAVGIAAPRPTSTPAPAPAVVVPLPVPAVPVPAAAVPAAPAPAPLVEVPSVPVPGLPLAPARPVQPLGETAGVRPPAVPVPPVPVLR